MSKAEKTKEFIIQKSAPIFNMKGYAGTSLSDIITVTGLTKGSIYGNFKNKDEVAIAVYKYNFNGLRKRIAESLEEKNSYYDKLIAHVDYYRLNWKQICERGGCPILNASIEADDNLSFLKNHVQDSIKTWTKDLNHIIEQGQKTKEFKASVDPLEYAYTIITLLEGGVMLLKIMNNKKLLFSALDRIVFIINTELKK
ncbi:MAG: TetR/AcrR family transcriptional regulator [Bacteroidota bacterium]